MATPPNHDAVNHPSHYTDGGIETIDILQAKLTAEEFRGFCKGNALKYLLREGKKEGVPVGQDAAKAGWYLGRLSEFDKDKYLEEAVGAAVAHQEELAKVITFTCDGCGASYNTTTPDMTTCLECQERLADAAVEDKYICKTCEKEFIPEQPGLKHCDTCRGCPPRLHPT